MGWGVPYLLPWALNDTGKALLGRGVQKKMPWAEEYLFYGLSWISPVDLEVRTKLSALDAHYLLFALLAFFCVSPSKEG